ncbi:MAG: hypothetical protein DWQ01_00295 [Planctomycetota bacterium]|nr:MAG: hypothetical protein DWQ01_00295 [Planctomycetota bacterium]
MRTLLSQFCEEFEAVVKPLLTPLHQAAEALGNASESIPARRILPGLRDNRHQLQALAEKVGEQQAYVLIFGPLKSGKSTLMNAMSAAYVSEVTSLPAYPCMVYVTHSEQRELEITRYSGEKERLSDLAALRMQLNRAHTELAEQIREVEEEGEQFDPGIHYPQAIRRVDVRVPAPELAQSGAVLVDTPGLYTRMKFGYDRMTRDFRDTAACAIFVVKTENLFLEQVFAEFNELLALFSRIFLLVNLDTTKKDLRPDGSLVPSLEHDDPIRIIEAFENLSMSAPLKAAADEGRLRIYPVDLLRAASARLQARDEEGLGQPLDEEPIDPTKQADFDSFLTDLTDYLNSTDYLVAFLGDSLRHANSLLEELRTLCGNEAVLELVRQVEELEARKESASRLGDRIQKLEKFGWEPSFGNLHAALRRAVDGEAEDIREKTRTALGGAVENWFQNDTSLRALVEDQVNPLLASCQNELALLAQKSLRENAGSRHGGAKIASSMEEDLTAANIDLLAIGRKAMDQVDPYSGVSTAMPQMDTAEIPVRKSFWDWILFRGMAAVQRRVFGSPERPTHRIPRQTKGKRMGSEAKVAIREQLDDFLDQFFPEAVERIADTLYGNYVAGAVDGIRRHLRSRVKENQTVLEQLATRLNEVAQVRSMLGALETASDRAQSELEGLSSHYGETDPELLIQPVEGEDEPAEEAVAVEVSAEVSSEDSASQEGGSDEDGDLLITEL